STESTDSARYSLNQDMVLAALGGLALGLTILVRIDGLSDILPAVPFLRALPPGHPVRRGPDPRGRLRPGRRLPEVAALPGPGSAVTAPPRLHRRGHP